MRNQRNLVTTVMEMQDSVSQKECVLVFNNSEEKIMIPEISKESLKKYQFSYK